MARIEKLQIQGFRSFSADDSDPGPQKIDFFRRQGPSPLTLIVGQNGCGKTTVIECLRYVTTGDCPPGSSSGRSFIHDPKMAKEAVVTANVKLQFVGQDGDKYLISRSMEATQKAKNITVKTLDSTITRRKADGTVSTLSMKCADINSQIFHTLGVSKPILNYVIFCHQEDSNWPLDEGSKVKDKFDEIFASAKYKECLKNIKDVRAQEKRLHQDLTREMDYLSSDKRMADEKKKELKLKKSNRNDLQAQLDSIEEELEPLRKDLMDLNEVEKNFSGIQEKIVKAETNLEHCRREMHDLRKNVAQIIPLSTSDELIEEMKSSLSGEQQDKREKISELATDLRRLNGDRDRISGQMDNVTSRIGECRGLKSKHEKDKKELRNALVNAGRALGWDVEQGSEAFQSDGDISDAVENISDTIVSLEDKSRKQTEESDAKIEEQAATISRFEIQQAQIEEQKKMKTSEAIKMKREVAALKRQISEANDDSTSTRLDDVKRHIDKIEIDIQTMKSNFDPEETKSIIQSLKSELVELEQRENRLRDERASLESVRKISAEIGIKKSDRDEKQRKVDRILSKNCNELSQVFDGSKVPETDTLKGKFDEKFEQFSESKKKVEREIQRLKAEMSSKKDHKKSVQQDLTGKEDRLKQLQRRIEEVISVDEDFDEALSNAKAEVDRARLELQVKEATKFTNQEFIERIQKMQTSSQRSKPCCPTCSRPFEKDSEVETLLEDLQSEIKKIPTKVQSLQAKLKRATAKQDKLQSLLPDKKQIDELKREIDEKKAQIGQLEKEIKRSEDSLGDQEEALEAADLDFSNCQNLRDDIFNVDRLYMEIVTLNRRIDELKDQCPEMAGARDYDAVNAEVDEVSRKITAVREQLDSNQNQEVKFDKRINDLERQKNSFLNEKLVIERRSVERAKMEAKRQELEENIKTFETAIAGIDLELKPLAAEIREANIARSKLMNERDRKSADLKREIEKVKKIHNQVLAIEKQVNDYLNSGNEAKMNSLSADQERLANKRSEFDARIKAAEAEKSNLEQELTQQESKRRIYDDNIRLRNYMKQEKEFESQKRNHEAKLERLEFGSVKKKKNDILVKYDRLEKSQSEKKGRLAEMEVAIKSLEGELETDKLKNAGSKYQAKSVEARCRQITINDLNKYYMALEWAIMRFHKERMSQINKIIREMWRNTYKGNDIDYIEIKTDDLETAGGADKRKVVNYRVVMIKNETELEMRGRCSAGQKVLASLIIRLALAETFSTSLGIIALDEPTTNLDRENIESLAISLTELVMRHSLQSNFQLIVITHDEDLIELLSRVDQVDHFYRVSRNNQGLSIIRRQTTEN